MDIESGCDRLAHRLSTPMRVDKGVYLINDESPSREIILSACRGELWKYHLALHGYGDAG
ncbi:MAG: hypothetical protein QNJ46_19130 [Leptolyngbyaceae cyanobacterium MO_188.B28]|nr:hypothetical protein [Leptolyngbyaceae cyanobacterium MO_188.B28]